MEQKWTDYLDKRSHPLSATANYRARVIKKHDVHLLRAKDSTGRTGCYFLYIPPTRKAAFFEALKKPQITNLNDYGEILASNYGYQPTEETKRLLREKFGLEV